MAVLLCGIACYYTNICCINADDWGCCPHWLCCVDPKPAPVSARRSPDTVDNRQPPREATVRPTPSEDTVVIRQPPREEMSVLTLADNSAINSQAQWEESLPPRYDSQAQGEEACPPTYAEATRPPPAYLPRAR